MAGSNGPGQTGGSGPGNPQAGPREDDLETRKRVLGAAIAARRPERQPDEPKAPTSGMAGMGYAMRLSSEFIAGVVVGVAIGWIVDRLAGTSPLGLIVFLLLGFGAGVLNVLRSVGRIAEHTIRKPDGDGSAKK